MSEREPELEPDDIQLEQTETDEPAAAPLSQDQLASLTRLLRIMYPHGQFPDGPYQRTAEIVRDNAAGDLVAGIDRLDQAAGGSLAQADDAAAAAAVEGLGNEDELLLAVHAVAINTLYDDHEVWSILGYEGPSFDKGGYINRGFNDLDWLPDPRIDEYDGPGRVENVPLASNGGN